MAWELGKPGWIVTVADAEGARTANKMGSLVSKFSVFLIYGDFLR
jgi:hypothetical protein